MTNELVVMNILNQLLALIGKIPAAFWGIVIGSFFSLGGIVIANRANDRRMQKQLEHDRKMRNRERELSLRKDVYLAAAEAITVGITSIGQYTNLEVPDSKLTEAFVNKSSAIAKVHVIANEPTVKSLVDLTDALLASYIHLTVKRIPLTIQNNQIAMLRQQDQRFCQTRDQMLELMKQYNLDGLHDEHRWKTINDNFKFEQDRIDESSKQQANLFTDLMMQHTQLLKECISETNKISRLFIPFIASARAELDMPMNERAYTEIIEQSIKKNEVNAKAFMENIESITTTEKSIAPDAQTPAPLSKNRGKE